MHLVIRDYLKKYEFNEGVNDGNIHIYYKNEFILNAHTHVLLICSEYIKNIYDYENSIEDNPHELFELLSNIKNNPIRVNLPVIIPTISKSKATYAIKLLLNLIYNYNFPIKTAKYFNNDTIFVLTNCFADFLLLNKKSMKILKIYYDIVEKLNRTHDKSEIIIIKRLNIFSYLASDYGNKLSIILCKQNKDTVKTLVKKLVNDNLGRKFSGKELSEYGMENVSEEIFRKIVCIMLDAL
jgi:hypothetical protein